MRMPMRTGTMRHQIELQSATKTTLPSGAKTSSWSTYDTVFASIEQAAATETLSAERTEAKATHKILIWSNASLFTKHRIKFGSRYFNIVTIRNVDEIGERMEIDAIEVVA